VKTILKILLVAEAVLVLLAVWLFVPRNGSASYKSSETKIAATGSTQTVYESPWMQIDPQELEERRRQYTFKPKIATCSLLALNLVGILYVARRVKRKP
jgi:hypothetical protein